MTVDTGVPGNVDDVAYVAGWVRDRFATTVDASAQALAGVRIRTDSVWDGTASEKAVERLGAAEHISVQLADGARTMATALDAFACSLRVHQHQGAEIRDAAAASGLLVVDGVVLDPQSQAQGDAYAVASSAVEALEGARRLAVHALLDAWNAVQQTWMFHLVDMVGSALESIALHRESSLRTAAQALTDRSRELLDAARAAPPGSVAAEVYRDVDLARTLSRSADELVETAEQLANRTARIGAGIGIAALGIGVLMDLNDGESLGQALASGGAGFAASVATGAAIGSVIPIGGTAVGAVAGLFVGAAASGGVDALFTEGVGGFAEGAWSATEETGGAIGDLATSMWDAVF